MAERILTIVVTYNGMQWIDRCLSSVCSSTMPSDLFVYDNCSTDGTADYVGEHFPAAHLVRSEENLGFAAANNAGMKYALKEKYDFVYLLNQDAWVMPDTFEKLAAEFGRNRKWGILSPKQMKADMSAPDEQFERHAFKNKKTPYKVKFVMAAHWMISRKCLEDAGLFSPAFQHYGEDNNLCDRARFHGYRVGVVPTAIAVHDRASRPRPLEYKMKLKLVAARVSLSNPNVSFWFAGLWQPLKLVIISLLYGSAIPLNGIPALFKDYDTIWNARVASITKGAFTK